MKKELTRKEFNILVSALETGATVETDNTAYQRLKEIGYLDQNGITLVGKTALDRYHVKRAIFLAAGTGMRLRPITINTPKPLVRVNGIRIIDTLLDAVVAAGIEEIYIVRGYLGEQFDQLLAKYPMLRFLENKRYSAENNISSIMCARMFLQNAYIMETDLLLRTPELICPYHYTSNYLGIPKAKTDDWCFIMRDHVIHDWKIGGTNCYQEVGISYWDAEDGEKLAKHIKSIYESPGGKELFWDHVPLIDFREEYKVEVRECLAADVTEIDTFSDLKALDHHYDI